ncbi:MAG: hypothetical protein HUJ26_20125 [Planctomycetaceae bacterium]|nr:hypothetical protein [Planctomycetaceae bacterium]
MNELQWISFWEGVLFLGLGSYLILALVIVPLGAVDIVRLFRKLEAPDQSAENQCDESDE